MVRPIYPYIHQHTWPPASWVEQRGAHALVAPAYPPCGAASRRCRSTRHPPSPSPWLLLSPLWSVRCSYSIILLIECTDLNGLLVDKHGKLFNNNNNKWLNSHHEPFTLFRPTSSLRDRASAALSFTPNFLGIRRSSWELCVLWQTKSNHQQTRPDTNTRARNTAPLSFLIILPIMHTRTLLYAHRPPGSATLATFSLPTCLAKISWLAIMFPFPFFHVVTHALPPARRGCCSLLGCTIHRTAAIALTCPQSSSWTVVSSPASLKFTAVQSAGDPYHLTFYRLQMAQKYSPRLQLRNFLCPRLQLG